MLRKIKTFFAEKRLKKLVRKNFHSFYLAEAIYDYRCSNYRCIYDSNIYKSYKIVIHYNIELNCVSYFLLCSKPGISTKVLAHKDYPDYKNKLNTDKVISCALSNINEHVLTGKIK